MDYIAVTDNNDSPLSDEDFNIFYADYESSVDEEEEEEEEMDVDCDYETMTVKQLLRIRDYYNIPKSGKVPKKISPQITAKGIEVYSNGATKAVSFIR